MFPPTDTTLYVFFLAKQVPTPVILLRNVAMVTMADSC